MGEYARQVCFCSSCSRTGFCGLGMEISESMILHRSKLSLVQSFSVFLAFLLLISFLEPRDKVKVREALQVSGPSSYDKPELLKLSEYASCDKCNCGWYSSDPAFAVCCEGTSSCATLSKRDVSSALNQNETILFLGESTQRGVYIDFVRIISNNNKFFMAANSGKNSTSCTTINFHRTQIKACFLFIGGTFHNDWINNVKVSKGQRAIFALNSPSVYERVEKEYLDIGEISVTYLGITTWDMLFVDNIKLYKIGLSKLVDIVKKHSRFVVLRSTTPMGYPLQDWQGTKRALNYHKRTKEYRKVILGMADNRVDVVDMYDQLHEYGLEHPFAWEGKLECDSSIDALHRECKVNEIKISKRKCSKLKKNTECGNYIHISCTKCEGEGADGDGFLSSVLAQAMVQLFVKFCNLQRMIT